MKLYKSLTPDRKSWYDGKAEWVPGQPMPVLTGAANGPCGPGGYHFAKSIEQAVGYGKFPLSLWEAEPLGDKLGEDDTKVRHTGGMIVREIKKPIWIMRTEKFIASIKSIKWLDNHGKINPRWKTFDTRDAAGNAAEDAAEDAARDAARDAAWNAAWNAARDAAEDAARDAARDAAWDAAWNAARDAAEDAAEDAARDAARDAALVAQMEICCGLDIPAKYRKYARDRWAVWQAGYGCLCDVNGVLYCYKKP